MRAAIALLAALGAIAVFGAWLMADLWAESVAEMPAFGWWAIGVGAALTILIGCGLMALTFFSARAGYDSRAVGDETDPQPPNRIS